MAAALTFLKNERIIQVDAPQTTVDIQDLVNQIRVYEANLLNLDYPSLANASGKQSLGGGSYVGITLELINNWRLAFEARSGPDTVLCTVAGGNLVATNIYSNNPISPTAFTQVNIAQSSSATIIQPDSNYGMLYLLESLKGRNRSVGTMFYWNPNTGSDSNDGLSPTNAVATFSKAQTLATAGAGDIIFAISTATGGITTTTEKITITKAGLKVRGAGYAFQMIPATNGTPTVTISADSVEFEGFFVKTAAGGTDDGVVITGDNVLVKDCWINNVTGDGIDISSSARSVIDTCVIEDSDANGIKVGATTTNLKVRQSIISGSGVDGVDLTGSGLTDNIFETNLIFNNTGYGIDIGTGVTRTGVRLNHTFSGNTLGATRDLGTGSFIETPAGGESASAIADAVWDEVIAGHTTAGTAGQILKATKLKATIASLK
jgi:hypothetical protein